LKKINTHLLYIENERIGNNAGQTISQYRPASVLIGLDYEEMGKEFAADG